MAGLVVVDTDLFIDFFRDRGPGAGLIRELVTEHRLRVTAVTAFELRVGAGFVRRRADIFRLLAPRALPLDLASAVIAGHVASDLREAGREIGMADSMQAAICLRFDLPFATRNRKHFDRVDRLQLIDVG